MFTKKITYCIFFVEYGLLNLTMGKPKIREKLTHNECLYKLCMLCFTSTVKKFIKITDENRQIINEHLCNGISAYFDYLPKVLCGSCYNTVLDAKSGIFKRSINFFDFSLLKVNKNLRSQTDPECDCTVCDIVTAPLNKKNNKRKEKKVDHYQGRIKNH